MSTHIFFFGVNPQIWAKIWANNYDSNKIEELNLVGLTTTIRKGEFFVFLSHVTLLNNRIFFPNKNYGTSFGVIECYILIQSSV
jgi:hypothetical protein